MKKHFFPLYGLILGLIYLSGCGKHETEGRTAGTLMGAAVGNAVAGRKDKGTGTLIGSLIGNLIGGAIGQEEDEKEREEEAFIKDRHHHVAVRKLQLSKAENRRLKEKLEKWCGDCSRKVKILDAQSCPSCGGDLIREKLCRRCKTSFSPEAGYRYCPYCRNGILLSSR